MASLKTIANPVGALPDDFEAPEGLVAVAMFEEYPSANDSGLAVLAMGCAYWMVYAEPCYVMCVDEHHAPAVQAELEVYWALQVKRSEAVAEWPLAGATGWPFAIYAFVLIGAFMGQTPLKLLEPGRMDAIAVVEQSQVWRGLTALMLHSDVVHLVSNLVAGIGFTLLVCRLFGVGLGWLLVVLAGIGGNLATAWLYYPDPHFSIGASTGIFGALGLLTASGVWMTFSARQVKLSLPQWMLPLIAGFVLLGLLGVGQGPVDVLAHFNGFLVGGLLGAVASAFRSALIRNQTLCAWLMVVLVLVAWFSAFSFGSPQSALP